MDDAIMDDPAQVKIKRFTAKPVVATELVSAVEPAKAESTIYVGPNIPGGALRRYTIFKGGVVLPHVQKLIEKTPDISKLIVPVSSLGAVESRLENQTSVEYVIFSNIVKQGA